LHESLSYETLFNKQSDYRILKIFKSILTTRSNKIGLSLLTFSNS